MTTSGGVIELLQARLAELHAQRREVDREIDMTRRVLVEAQRVADEMPAMDYGVDAIATDESGDVRVIQTKRNGGASPGKVEKPAGDRIIGRSNGGSPEPRYGRSVRTIVLDVMSEEPGRRWTSAEISRRVHDRVGSRADGKLSNNVRASLYTAKNSGEVERSEEDGKYRLLVTYTTPDADPAPARGREAESEPLQLMGGGDSAR